jgi:hypothetical protein
MNREYVRVLQPGCSLDLAKESLWTQDGGQCLVQNLERNWPVVAEVVGKIYDGHASMSELALNDIAVA